MKTRRELINKAAIKVGKDFEKATDVAVFFTPSKNIASDYGELLVVFYTYSTGYGKEVARATFRVNTKYTDVSELVSSPSFCTIKEYIEEA